MSKITSYYGKRKRGAYGSGYQSAFKRRRPYNVSKMNSFSSIPSNIGQSSAGMTKTFVNLVRYSFDPTIEVNQKDFIPTDIHSQKDKDIINVFGSIKVMYVVAELVAAGQAADGISPMNPIQSGIVGLGITDKRAAPAGPEACLNEITNMKTKPAGVFMYSQTNMKVLYKPIVVDESTVMTPATYLGADKSFFNTVFVKPTTADQSWFYVKYTTKLRCMMA